MALYQGEADAELADQAESSAATEYTIAVPLSARLSCLPAPQLSDAVTSLAAALKRDDQPQVQGISQRIVNQICRRLGVRSVRVQVQGVRPSNRRGELHGLYTQYTNGS